MKNSVMDFLEQYEWGYPFDQRNDCIDRTTIKREVDRLIMAAENRRFYEPISVGNHMEEKVERRYFIGF